MQIPALEVLVVEAGAFESVAARGGAAAMLPVTLAVVVNEVGLMTKPSPCLQMSPPLHPPLRRQWKRRIAHHGLQGTDLGLRQSPVFAALVDKETSQQVD